VKKFWHCHLQSMMSAFTDWQLTTMLRNLFMLMYMYMLRLL